MGKFASKDGAPPKRKRPPLDKNNPPRTLGPDEAAEYAGLTLATYYRHVHPSVARGDILSLPIGRQRRIITASLDAWLLRQAREGWQ
jgi:excisionase family DNA binding protein